jgi:hypothetical protein
VQNIKSEILGGRTYHSPNPLFFQGKDHYDRFAIDGYEIRRVEYSVFFDRPDLGIGYGEKVFARLHVYYVGQSASGQDVHVSLNAIKGSADHDSKFVLLSIHLPLLLVGCASEIVSLFRRKYL